MSQGDMTHPTIDDDFDQSVLEQDIEDLADIAPPEAVTDSEDLGSIKAQLRAEYEQAADALDATEVFDVEPSQKFAIRYRYVDPKKLEASARQLRKVRDEGAQMTLMSCDTLIAACDEILVYGPAGKLIPLFDASPENPEPLRFDSRLCEVLGWPTDTRPRRMVILLFKQNIHAIRRQAMEVSAWIENVGADVRESLAGE